MADARAITMELRGRWFGSYGLAFCPAHHNTKSPALGVKDGHEGRTLVHCYAGCPPADVLSALRGRGLIDGAGRVYAPDPVLDARRRAEEAAEAARQIAKAWAVWAETVPGSGTLVEHYHRARCITGPIPESLRFHPACWHGATARRLPAMVAGVTRAGTLVAVHRCYLAAPGRKADVSPAKAMLGPVAGGAVVLSTGPGPVVVAEGIETALSLRDALADPGATVLAALSASGMAGLDLPPVGRVLVICPDPDPPGWKAARSLAERAHAAGRDVQILPPPEGLDWNDWAQARGGAA